MTGTTGVAVAGRAPLPAAVAARAVGEVLRRERRRAFISLTFVGRDRMAALNRRFKGRRGPTDVLAFALPGPEGALAGDVYVCPWYAAREAQRHGVSLREELIRLIVHGTLHVLGWEHPEDEGRGRSPMWQRQERYVAVLT
jgi:probable rRNA maturation factor